VHQPDVLAMTTTTTGLDAELEAFLQADYPRVVAAVALITRDRGRAEDAVQDAIVKTLARPPREPIASYAAWITVIATNEARMGHRRRGIESRAYERAEAVAPSGSQPDPASIEHLPVLDAMGTLPLQQRRIVVMHYYLDQSVANIARDLRVSEGTVKTQLHRARATLAPVLGADEEGDLA
jgi:RNA polymerase sigma-70 factor (ECF subfamily)